MITVDVKVPSIGRKYEFNLDENVKVSFLISEMREVICRKEQCELKGTDDMLELCSEDKRKVLKKERTLCEQNIRNAESLIFL